MNKNDIEVQREQFVTKLRDAYGKIQEAADAANEEIATIFQDVKTAVNEYNVILKEAKDFVDNIDDDMYELSNLFEPDEIDIDLPEVQVDDESFAALELEDLEIEVLSDDEDE
jgi:hypothetical protein